VFNYFASPVYNVRFVRFRPLTWNYVANMRADVLVEAPTSQTNINRPGTLVINKKSKADSGGGEGEYYIEHLSDMLVQNGLSPDSAVVRTCELPLGV
jgi:hypothetical protein